MTTTSLEEIARRLHRIDTILSNRSPQLVHSSLDDGALATTAGGSLSALYGVQWDGTSTSASLTGPTPPTPTIPVLVQIVSGVRVSWPGSFVDPQAGFTSPVVAPMDWAYLMVQVSDTADFSGTVVVSKQIQSAGGGSADFTWGRVNTPLYARQRTVSQSGKPSAWSPVAGPLASGGLDVTIPRAPGDPTLTSTASLGTNGEHVSNIVATWVPPSANTDNTLFDDFAYYVVQWWYTGAPANVHEVHTVQPTIAFTVGGPGLEYAVRVAAVDQTAHQSAWTNTQLILGAVDTTPPNAPSTPQLSSYYGQLRIYWDGLDNAGHAMPADFAVVQVHVSATLGFTPTAATLVSTLATAGAAFATAPYGATRYVKFVALDSSFNASAASTQASGSTVQVADGDIASLNIGKLTAGQINVDVVVAGRLATALTGARVEMNALGFQKFDVDGITKLVSITGTEALLTGTYKSAASGRRIEMGSGGTTGELDFYAPDGTLSFVRAYTESSGIESIQMGVPIVTNAGASADGLWNRWHANSDEWAEMRSNKLDFIFGTHRPTALGFFVVRQSGDRGQTATVRLSIDNGGYLYQDATGQARSSITATGMSYLSANGTQRMGFSATQFTISGNTGTNQPYILFNYSDGYFFVNHNSTDTYFEHKGDGTATFSMGTNKGDLIILPDAPDPNSAPWLQMFTGNGRGTMLIGYYQAGGTGLTTEHKAWDNSSWAEMRGSAFTVVSDGATKAGIRDFDQPVLDEFLEQVRPRVYTRRQSAKVTRMVGRPQEELGLVLQEAPPWVRRPGGIDAYQFATYLAAVIKELHGSFDARLRALEGTR